MLAPQAKDGMTQGLSGHVGGKPATKGRSVAPEVEASPVPEPPAALHTRRDRPRVRRERSSAGLAPRQNVADARLAHERRQVAADVHDLVMQDLSLALATTRMIAHEPARAAELAADAVAAAERALAAARGIIGELADREHGSIVALLERTVHEAARGTPLDFSATATLSEAPDPPTADTLVHIGREAVTNAVKHAGASRVHVSLSHDEEWRLTVRDDGRGFDPLRATPGFGLSSMRAQASALGGSMMLRSAIGKGSEVEVTLP